METRYEEMLKRAYSKLPPKVFEYKRFEVPKPRSSVIGMRTTLHNFIEISDALNRDPQHLLRFLSKEMATSGNTYGSRAIFQGKFSDETLKRLINRYVNEFVMCPVCKRPDTKIVKEERFHFMVCEACGAKTPIRPS